MELSTLIESLLYSRNDISRYGNGKFGSLSFTLLVVESQFPNTEHKIIEWLGLKDTFKDHLVHGVGYLSLGLNRG